MQVMINYCFIVKNINGLEGRISTSKMEHFKKSDTVLAEDSEVFFDENSMSLPPQDTVLVQESQDLIDENSMSFPPQDTVFASGEALPSTSFPFICPSCPVAPQETIELCANSLELATTDPQEGTSGIIYVKHSSSSASADTSDDDLTPDLDLGTIFSNDITDKNEHSKNHAEIKKIPCSNWTKKMCIKY